MHIEDIHVGDFVAVTGSLIEVELPFSAGNELQWTQRGMSGMPCEVLAVSPPFICVKVQSEAHKTPQVIDTRSHKITKVSREFVDALSGKTPVTSCKWDPNKCTKCGETKIERLISGVWERLCTKCEKKLTA